MSASISKTTGQRYGVLRVCNAWRVPRSSFYAWQRTKIHPAIPLATAMTSESEAVAGGSVCSSFLLQPCGRDAGPMQGIERSEREMEQVHTRDDPKSRLCIVSGLYAQAADDSERHDQASHALASGDAYNEVGIHVEGTSEATTGASPGAHSIPRAHPEPAEIPPEASLRPVDRVLRTSSRTAKRKGSGGPPRAAAGSLATEASRGCRDLARSEHDDILSSAMGPNAKEPSLANELLNTKTVAPSTFQRSKGRRGPVPKVSDADLLVAIREDLEASPFRGEGHRKVSARLRRKGICVSRKRILRLMREHQLLSPHRSMQGEPVVHDGTIITEKPCEMWGTDGLRIETVQEGWIWVFVAVEHWNAECVGFHACKEGNRFAALEPIAQGIQRYFGSTETGVVQGLSIRSDHGTQYTSDHFQRQIKVWGAKLSYGYVSEPETNGVVERFNRTLKEQVFHGKIFHTVEEIRVAVAEFVAQYNAQWLVEKNGFRSPLEMRESLATKLAA